MGEVVGPTSAVAAARRPPGAGCTSFSVSRSRVNRGSRRSGSCGAAAGALAGGAGRRWPAAAAAGGRGRSRASYLRAGLVDVDADHPGELAGEGVDLGPVADARRPAAPPRAARRRGRRRGRGRTCATTLAEHEAVERHPAGDQLAHRGVALLDAAGRRGPARRARPRRRSARRSSGRRRRPAAPPSGPAASPSKVKITSPRNSSWSCRKRRSTRAWSSPNAVPQVATAVGTPARWQAITSV